MKKMAVVLAGVMALANVTGVLADDEKQPAVKVDGIQLKTDRAPIIENDRVLVPMRAIFEALDAQVDWDDSQRKVTATKENSVIELTVGQDRYIINGEEKELDVAAKIVNNRTMVPIRVVSESLDCKVNWDEDKYIVDVTTPAHQAVVEETDRIRAIEPTIDTVYKEAAGTKLPIKIYIPEDSENSHIAVLAIHGGSWYAMKGEWEKWGGSWMNYQAQYYYDKYGYTTAAFSYRSINVTEDTVVAELIEDCKDAVKFFKENTDCDKLIIMGDSSGGNLAVELGMDDEIGADIIVAANPVLDLTEDSWAHTAPTDEERIAASPALNVKKVNAKFLVIHGNADTVVNYEISKKFCEDMKALGNQCDYIELDGINHAFILSRYQSTDEQINEYMDMIDEYIAENLDTEEA